MTSRELQIVSASAVFLRSIRVEQAFTVLSSTATLVVKGKTKIVISFFLSVCDSIYRITALLFIDLSNYCVNVMSSALLKDGLDAINKLVAHLIY